MNREMGQFNTEIKLFKEQAVFKSETLLFIRWLAEKQGKTHSAPAGDLALAMAIKKEEPPVIGQH